MAAKDRDRRPPALRGGRPGLPPARGARALRADAVRPRRGTRRAAHVAASADMATSQQSPPSRAHGTAVGSSRSKPAQAHRASSCSSSWVRRSASLRCSRLPWFLLLLRGRPTRRRLSSAFWERHRATSAQPSRSQLALGPASRCLRSEKWLLTRMNATLVPKGEMLDTKFALKDMAIAAGLPVAPALYLMPETSTNAFVFAARRRRAVIGVTEGFTRKLTIDQQRAVFANLIARLASGDTIVSTGVTALMWPVHAWRGRAQTRGRCATEFKARQAARAAIRRAERSSGARRGDSALLLVRGRLRDTRRADGGGPPPSSSHAPPRRPMQKGMLLLKDPTAMLSALKRCIELNNVVPAAGEAFAELFYCWTGHFERRRGRPGVDAGRSTARGSRRDGI